MSHINVAIPPRLIANAPEVGVSLPLMMKDKIMETLNAGFESIKKGMRDGADNYKIEGKIIEQKKEIKRLTKEIGTLTILRLEAGDEMCPEIMERFDAIKAAQAEIEVLENSIKTSKLVCPRCGAKNSNRMNFCGQCGTALKQEESVVSEIVDEVREKVSDVEEDVKEKVEKLKED